MTLHSKTPVIVAAVLTVIFIFFIPEVVNLWTKEVEYEQEKQNQLEFNIRAETWKRVDQVGDNYLERNLNGEVRWITEPVENE